MISWFRWPASITTYAVITLVIDPIGRSVTDDWDQRSLPVASFASSAHGARTPTGPGAALALRHWRLSALRSVAARAAGPAARIITATIPAATVDAAKRPVIRIGPSFCTSERG